VSFLRIGAGKKLYFNRSQRTRTEHLSLSTFRGIETRGSSVAAGSCGTRPEVKIRTKLRYGGIKASTFNKEC
jgi:hypothetical protein